MKKSTLALAVAAALVGFGSTAYADTTLYGSARVSVDYEDQNARVLDPDGAWDVFNNASRLGVRGEEELGGGLSAIYQYEFGVDVTEGGNLNESSRPKWVGLKGANWGSITLGTQWTPYYNVIGVGDVYNSSKVFDRDVYLGDAFGLRMDNSVMYTTPSWSGFSLQAMVVMNGTPNFTSGTNDNPGRNNDPNDITANGVQSLNVSSEVDMWHIAAAYRNGPWFAGAAYMSLEGNQFDRYTNTAADPNTTAATITDLDREQWGVAFGYNAEPFGVTIAYENGSLNDLNLVGDTENIYATGRYTWGPNVFRAAYGLSSADRSISNARQAQQAGLAQTARQGDANNWILGYEYDFSKRTRIWVEYLNSDYKDGLPDTQTVSIGTRHDF